ncbi:MAG TPA: hypothetical protein PLT66_07150 [Bacillota bacterium]|nr:hypothetical protein [Bacillota bacterium]
MAQCEKLYKYLPVRFMRFIASLNEREACEISEARLRLGGPFTLHGGGKTYAFSESGERACIGEAYRCSEQDIEWCVDRLCCFSRYSFEEAICNGYIPLPDGSRAGISGETICENGKVKNISRITSVNIRIKRSVPGFAQKLCDYLFAHGLCGVLVLSPPMYGKTTLLSSAALILGKSGLKVAVVDERNELWGAKQSSCGCCVDVMSGCPKAKAIEMLTRTMSPQVIVCDEISFAEADALAQTQNAGVSLIASLHADSHLRYIRWW